MIGTNLAGGMVQNGHLVDDLDDAMRHFTMTMGAGPFFVLPPRRFVELYHDGEPATDSMIAAVAMGQVGPVQIELIVPAPGPSTYRRFLDHGGRGLHHFGYITDDYDAMRTEAIKRGLRPATEGRSQATRVCYLEDPEHPEQPVVELIENCQTIADTFALVAGAHADWDGTDPVRYL